MPKHAVVSVISDLLTDQRVHRTALTLTEEGWDVLLVGRKLKDNRAVTGRPYPVHRFRLIIQKGPFFYLIYNIRLFFFLLFRKTDLLVSNDLDTLPANFLISRLRSLPLIYDSHEYFTGVPELTGRPFIRNIWKKMEQFMVPRLKYMLTVNESIAELYRKEYGIPVGVMRNVPLSPQTKDPDRAMLRRELNLPAGTPVYILQGSGINVQRGAEEAVEAMQYVNGLLVIAGSGDVMQILKDMTLKLNLQQKVLFTGRLSQEDLRKYTLSADIGLSLDKDLSINYRFSLPNKLFDYIHAGIPVLASDLPEVRKIVEKYQTGKIIASHEPKAIAAVLNEMISNHEMMETWRKNTNSAASELNWEREKQVLIKTVKSIG